MVNRTTRFNCRLPILSWIVTSIQLPPETIEAFPINQPIHLIPVSELLARISPVSIDESRFAFNSCPPPSQPDVFFLNLPFMPRNTCVFTGKQPEHFSTIYICMYMYSWLFCLRDLYRRFLFFQTWFQFLLVRYIYKRQKGISNSHAQLHEFHLVEFPLGTISLNPPSTKLIFIHKQKISFCDDLFTVYRSNTYIFFLLLCCVYCLLLRLFVIFLFCSTIWLYSILFTF